MAKSESSEKKQMTRNEELAVKFLEYVRDLGICLLPENANELDAKEVKFIIDYLNQQFGEVLDQHETYQRLPIMVVTIYGDHRGHAMVYVNPSTDRDVAINFRLPKMVDDLKLVIDQWDIDRDKPLPEKSKDVDLTPFMAIKQHIRDGKE